MENFNIEMPDDFEIKQQINIILDKGLHEKQSFYSYIKIMYKNIGIKNLFHDLSELIFIGVLLISILAFGIIRININGQIMLEQIYTFIFIISPLFYLVTNLFSFISIKENNTYEMEMVCKYNLYQVSSLRMLVFSVLSILINSVVLIGLYNKIDIMRGIMISITSVFLFSSILLYAVVKLNSPIRRYIVIGGWVLINLIFIQLSVNEYSMVLQNIPIVVYLGVSFVCIYAYISNIKILSKYKKLFI
ncbi:MAG: hypothetical protein ACRC3Y_09570 [Romboutsia sp.]|uniref:hypothetical protein n=1 Tax=Romboutsia sp. TaxID=1965302 RepID=UPI003F3DE532